MKIGDLVRFKPNPFNSGLNTRKMHIVMKYASEGFVILYNYSSLPIESSLLEVISESR